MEAAAVAADKHITVLIRQGSEQGTAGGRRRDIVIHYGSALGGTPPRRSGRPFPVRAPEPAWYGGWLS